MRPANAQKSKVPDLKMQKNWPIGYRSGDLNTGYVSVSETCDSHMLRRSLSMPLGKSRSGTWSQTTGLQTGLFLPSQSDVWTVANNIGHAATAIRPTRTSLERSRHIQTGLSELEDEEQRERIREFNARHNGQWHDVKIAELKPTPPYRCPWVHAAAKKRTPAQAKAFALLQDLDNYLEKRKIRVKEMFQPYVPFGPGTTLDPEQLLLAFRRFHFAEDMGRADMLELMCCIDPTCNGAILLTELARCMVQIRSAKAEANSTVEEALQQTGYEKFIGQLEAQAATARSRTSRSSNS